MGNLVRPVDAADRLRLDLNAFAREFDNPFTCVCTPLPADLERRLPVAWIRSLGGDVSSLVVEHATMSIDVYASTWKQATDRASDAHMLVSRLPLLPDTLTDWQAVTALSLPYENPDPEHPTIPRCSFSLTAVLKADTL